MHPGGFSSLADKHVVVMMMMLCMLSHATDEKFPHLICKTPEMISLQNRLPGNIRCTVCAAGLLRPIQEQNADFTAMQTRLVCVTNHLNACNSVPKSLLLELHLCCRRTKAQHVVDFENLPELPDNVFELAPHKDISLKAMPAVNTLLPPDHHYKVCLSCCLSQCQQPSVQMSTAE